MQKTLCSYLYHLEEKVKYILLHTEKGKSLLLSLEYCIEQHSIKTNEIFLDLQNNNLLKIFEQYKEMKHIKQNMECF